MRRLITIAATATAIACAGTDPPEHDDVSGLYQGPVSGSGVSGSISLTISQKGGSLSGTWAASLTIVYNGDTFTSEGSGTFTGTIEAGVNPQVDLVATGACNATANYTGRNNSELRTMTVSGPYPMYDAACQRIGNLVLTLALRKP